MDIQGVQRIQSFQSSLPPTINTDYLLYLPKGYDADQSKRWPCILFLHGVGERGHDLGLVKSQGLPKLLQECQDFPFIVVSPQCSPHTWWSSDALNRLLDE